MFLLPPELAVRTFTSTMHAFERKIS